VRKGGLMERISEILIKVSNLLNMIYAVPLAFMLLLTVANVFMRAGGRLIIGSYEIVSILLAVVIGFNILKISL